MLLCDAPQAAPVRHLLCRECLSPLPPYAGRGRPRLFCSPSCYSRHWAREQRALVGPRPSIPCAACSKPFVRRHKRSRFCSEDCYRAALYPRVGQPCRFCDQPMEGRARVFCTPEHSRLWKLAQRRSVPDWEPAPIVCPECDQAFFPGTPQTAYCGKPCERRHTWRIQNAKRRAPELKSEMVDPFEVFERDGWRCRRCGCSTPRRLRGTTHDRAPELDHIDPINPAPGQPQGRHTYRNSQCLCRKCNREKFNTAWGQLNLF